MKKMLIIIGLACVSMMANAHQWICENGQWHPVNMATMGMYSGGGKHTVYRDSNTSKSKKGISLSKGGTKKLSLSKGGTKKLSLTPTRTRNRKRK